MLSAPTFYCARALAEHGDAGDAYRDFRGRRLLLDLCRIGHVAGLAGVSAWVLSGADTGFQGGVVNGGAFGILLLVSGLGILFLDAWSNPAHFRQVNGLAMLLKLALVALMVGWDAARIPLFWGVLVFSVAISHASARLRHRRVL